MRFATNRMTLAVFPLLLIAVGVAGMMRAQPLFHVGPGSGFWSGTDLAVVAIPFWSVICLAVGLVLLVALLAAGGPRDVAAWSALFLLVLWLLQIAKATGFYQGEEGIPPGSSWATRYASISSRWWGLALLALAAAAVAVGSRLCRPGVGRASPSKWNTGSSRPVNDQDGSLI